MKTHRDFVSDPDGDQDMAAAPRLRQSRRIRRRMEKLRAARFQTVDRARAREGTVVRKLLRHYDIAVDGGGEVRCLISSKLRKRLLRPEADPASSPTWRLRVHGIAVIDPVAVGDRVVFLDGDNGVGQLVEVLPRRTLLARRAAGQKPMAQSIAANVDQAVPVLAVAAPDPKWSLLDRYLAGAEAAGLPAVICLAKTDLAQAVALAAADLYRRIGYRVVACSVVTGEGMEDLRGVLAGRVSVLIGKSGVGKTSLLNFLCPGLDLPVGELSASTGKGRHTTTLVERFDLGGGGIVVDTPGMREFGPWIEPGQAVAGLFPEMRPFLGRCRFAGCTHVHEPDCPLRAAVDAGVVAPSRYASYRALLTDG